MTPAMLSVFRERETVTAENNASYNSRPNMVAFFSRYEVEEVRQAIEDMDNPALDDDLPKDALPLDAF